MTHTQLHEHQAELHADHLERVPDPVSAFSTSSGTSLESGVFCPTRSVNLSPALYTHVTMLTASSSAAAPQAPWRRTGSTRGAPEMVREPDPHAKSSVPFLKGPSYSSWTTSSSLERDEMR